MFKRATNYRADLTQVEGLGDVIERAGPHRFNRVIDRLLAADHDDHGVGRMLQYARRHLEAAKPGHLNVAEHQIELIAAQQ